MIRGNRISIFGVLVLGAVLFLPQSAFAKKRKSPCDYFGESLAAVIPDVYKKGYPFWTQPLGKTKEAADAKIEEFRSYLATMEGVVNGSMPSVGMGCEAMRDAVDMLDAGKTQLAEFLAYPGPYGDPEIVFASSPAAVVNFMKLELPCRKSDSDEKNKGLRPCGEVIQVFTQNLDGHLKLLMDAQYRGCELGQGDPGQCKVITKTPTCNLQNGVTGIANSNPETETNHKGLGCGSWMQMQTWRPGKASNCHYKLINESLGDRINGYFRGAQVSAYDCAWAQVKNELAKGYIKLSAAKGGNPAELFEPVLDGLKQQRRDLMDSPNLGEIETCNAGTAATNKGHVKLSACMVATKRQTLESAFESLILKEVNNRARRSWERFYYGSKGKDITQELLGWFNMNKMREDGKVKCKSKESGHCNQGSLQSMCFNPLFLEFIHPRLESVWKPEVCQ